MGDRLPQRTLPQKSVTKAGVGIRVVGLYLKRFLPVSDRFVGATLRKKNVTTVVIGVCIIWLQFNCLLVMDHRFVGPPCSGEIVSEIHLHKGRTQIVVGVPLARPNPRGSLKMRDRFV